MQIQCGNRVLNLSSPAVMGILNITPDSFFDGGALFDGARPNLNSVIAKAKALVDAGAAILDVGGESTRPGAASVSSQQECDRVLPVVEALSSRFEVVVSVDTSNPVLMRESALLGAGLINDVRALERDGAIAAVAASGLPVCLMHMKGEPKNMQAAPEYGSVVAEVAAYLHKRALNCTAAGISPNKILIDPGFGFGKTDSHNLALLESLPELTKLGYPLLVGVSRKSMIGRLLGRDVEHRLPASLALALVALQRGANILRVHDVAETIDIVKIFELTQKRTTV